MKKYAALLSLGLLGTTAFAVPNTNLFTDSTANGGTSYTVGANLVPQFNTNLFSPWYVRGTNFGSVYPTIASGSLYAPGLPLSSGNCASFTPNNGISACLDFNIPASNTNTIYASFILKITDISAVSTSPANNSLAAFLDDPTSVTLGGNQIGRLGTRVLTKAVGSGYVLGTSRSATTGDFTYEPDAAAHSVDEPVFVVMALQRISGTGGPTNCLLWVNPPVTSYGSNQPPPATVVALSGPMALNNSARAFGIIQQSTAMPSGLIDDVRIATNWAFVTVGDPKIVTPPANKSVQAGNNATFTVSATGTGSLTYGWFKDGSPLSNSSHIGGAHTASVTVTNVGAGDLGGYVVYITNGLGAAVFTPTATLSFISDPAITNQPANFTTNYLGTATFSVGASGTAPLYYLWHKDGFGDLSDGGNISGSQSNVLTISGVSFPDTGYYYVTVSNGIAQVDSTMATLVVNDAYFPTNPVSITTNAGATVQFHAVASSSAGFAYQWTKNGQPIFNTGPFTGTDTDTLTIANVTSAEQATYAATVISFGATNATSLNATLTVLTPVSVTIQPRSRAVLQGVRAVFSVGTGGSGPFAYQWLRSGTNVAGATGSAYSLSNVQPVSAGAYSVVISNSFSAATSSVVSLSVSGSLSLAQTNVVIVRIGDGGQALSINGNSMFLDQYLQDGTYVNTITLPEDGPSAEVAIGWDNITGVNNGSTTGTSLTRSQDGRYMVVAGYNTNLNYNSSLMASSGTNVPKGIMTVDSFGSCVLAGAFTNTVFDNSFWRSGITDGTNNFWGGSGIAGTYYFGYSNAPALVQTNFVNTRNLALWNGDIYGASAANGTGIVKVNGLATTNGNASVIINGTTSSGTFDVAVNPAGNLIYVTDQRNVASGGGIQRYDFNGSNWVLTYTLNSGFGNLGPRYITADFSGADPVLYVTSNDQTFDNNRLLKLVDTGGGSTPTVLASASINQTFRGLHFGPVPNSVVPQPTLNYLKDANNLVLSWTGVFHLQSANQVSGPYVNVSGGTTSPYTNNVTLTNQLFFRLSN